MGKERGRSLPGVFWTAFKAQKKPIPGWLKHKAEYQLVHHPDFKENIPDHVLIAGSGFGDVPGWFANASLGPYLTGIGALQLYISEEPLKLNKLPLEELSTYLKYALKQAGDRKKSLLLYSASALALANQEYTKTVEGIILPSPYIGKESLRAQIPFKIAERYFPNQIPKTLWSVDEYMDLSKPFFSGLLADGKKIIVDLGMHDRIIDNLVVSIAFRSRYPQVEIRASNRGHDLPQTYLHNIIAELYGYPPKML